MVRRPSLTALTSDVRHFLPSPGKAHRPATIQSIPHFYPPSAEPSSGSVSGWELLEPRIASRDGSEREFGKPTHDCHTSRGTDSERPPVAEPLDRRVGLRRTSSRLPGAPVPPRAQDAHRSSLCVGRWLFLNAPICRRPVLILCIHRPWCRVHGSRAAWLPNMQHGLGATKLWRVREEKLRANVWEFHDIPAEQFSTSSVCVAILVFRVERLLCH